MNRALILGIGGQDGSYLADILLERGWEVHGFYRRSSVDNLQRIAHCRSRIVLHQGDLADSGSVALAIMQSEPNVIYNMADQDDARKSFDTPRYSEDITCGAVQRLLQMVRGWGKPCQIFQPLSALMFDNSIQGPYNECSPLRPMSPYAVAKVNAWNWCRFYREHYGIQVTCGIMFNHDSPRRGAGYLLQVICRQATSDSGVITIGNPEEVVDIGYAREYMEMVVRLMEYPEPQDWVIGTGQGHSIGSLARAAVELSEAVGITINKDYPKAVGYPLIADVTKLRREAGWKPKLVGSKLVELIMEGLL